MKRTCLLLLACLCACAGPGGAPQGPPNVVIIFCDDLGYSDVGVFGAEGFETPHLDRLAREGIRFTDFYVAAGSCTPSRAALMTGCYPQRVGLPHVIGPGSGIGINANEITIAELLKAQGYATACVGKWHLGDAPRFLPPNHGFDRYFGLPYSNDMSPVKRNNPNPHARQWPPLPLIRQLEVIEREPDQTKLVRRYTTEAVEFIEENRNRPFFLYFPHTFPHVPLWPSEEFLGRTKRGIYGDQVEEIDWSVGQVLATLERVGVADRTLVIFTSDNGPWLVKGSHGGTCKPLREGKGTSFEGGQREPCIMRWPERIRPGGVCRQTVTSMDILPTVAKLCGASAPTGRIIDGRDVRPVLLEGPDAKIPEKPFFYYHGWELQAVRSGKWKLHVPHKYRSIHGAKLATPDFAGSYTTAEIGLSLFDLEKDMGETTDVAGKHPDVVKRMLQYVEEMRADLGDALTKQGGKSRRPPGLRGNP